MAQKTSFDDWEGYTLAQAATGVIRSTKGYIGDAEMPVLQAMSDGAMAMLFLQLGRVFNNWPPHRQAIEELLTQAFLAGWACRGAVEAVLHNEVPEPAPVR